MRKVFFALSIALVVCLSTSLASASIIADWTFETSQPSTSGPISPEIGAGSASSSGVGGLNSPAGNFSSHSYSGNAWTTSSYWQFQVSTTGFSGIGFQWDQTGSSTGPSTFTLSYSTDGSTFTPILSNYTVLLNSPAWSVSTYTAAYTRFLDLSSTTTLDNQATLYFRLADASTSSIGGGTVASTGTDRVDNVIVTSPPVATAIPEPSSIVLCGLALLGLAGTARFRKKN